MLITEDTMAGVDKNVEGFRKSLLKWYDSHRRVLPWRAPKGVAANPYHVWLSEIMLQQTTVPAVIPYFMKFLSLWPDIHSLARANADTVMQNWAGLGYYARARNLQKCAQTVSKTYGGMFPQDIASLKSLPGIGDYTAAAIMAIAFNKPANVVDGNVERVMARIFNVQEPVPESKPQLKHLAGLMAAGEKKRAGDYAQSLMDLGATICTPQSPKCAICPVRGYCDGLRTGNPSSLPMRKPKGKKPQKHGYVYWITNKHNEILLEKRPENGLLGGTIGLPTSQWVEKDTKKPHLPIKMTLKPSKIKVLHSFTHFDLELLGVTATMNFDQACFDKDYFWVTIDDAADMGLPTVFKKAFKQFV